MKTTVKALAMASAIGVSSTALASSVEDVLTNYADIAQAKYEDSLKTASLLRLAIDRFLVEPTEDHFQAAKKAWITARMPYQQSEAYRFGNPIVDDWEGKVNAWPLDEGLIDYVDHSYGTDSQTNPYYTANIIANQQLSIAGQNIDASVIDVNLLNQLHEIDEVEANVAKGYHAIEFLLWGQDLNGTNAGAGNRPFTDFVVGEGCTGGNCDRRVDYLIAVTDLLIKDLRDIVKAWKSDGEARLALFQKPKEGLAAILVGMGSLSYGELAGERTKLGLMLHDPEEEHDCFSDNTAQSHYYDAKGIQNVFLGTYKRIDGSVVSGASIYDMLKSKNKKLARTLKSQLAKSVAKGKVLVISTDRGQAYDQLIAKGNQSGHAKVQGFVDALVAQTQSIEKAFSVLKLKMPELEGSDSLDNPSVVQ